jgi:ribose 5-phosphate isomerase B
MLRVGLAADHAGFRLKSSLLESPRWADACFIDFGAIEEVSDDDYPDHVLPLARAVAAGDVDRGVAVCGSGVGASIAANQIAGVRAAVCHDPFSAARAVEDDDLNLLCLGSWIVAPRLARELVRAFLTARFSRAPRHVRRLAKIEQARREAREATGEPGARLLG